MLWRHTRDNVLPAMSRKRPGALRGPRGSRAPWAQLGSLSRHRARQARPHALSHEPAPRSRSTRSVKRSGSCATASACFAGAEPEAPRACLRLWPQRTARATRPAHMTDANARRAAGCLCGGRRPWAPPRAVRRCGRSAPSATRPSRSSCGSCACRPRSPPAPAPAPASRSPARCPAPRAPGG